MNTIDQAKEFLKELIKFDSVEKPAAEGAPFGKGVDDCLRFALLTMRQKGFKTKYGEGFYGYGEVGEGELFGVLTHLDVVPVSGVWKHGAFAAEEADGRIYGRGALDDKGPFAAAFFAAVRLLEEGYKPKLRLRFILGCDEESGWKCMEKYLENEEMPAKGFSPDGDFPVINCEKGIVYHTVRFPLPEGVESLSGGGRANMVPDFAKAVLVKSGRILAALEKNNIPYELEGKRIVVTAYGKSAHGSHPDQGENALIKLLGRLSSISEDFRLMFEAFSSYDGSGIGLVLFDDKSGGLTLNLGCVRCENKECVFELDIRHPVSYGKDEITARLQNALPFTVTQGFYHLPLYVAEDNPLVQTLLNSYNEVTGENASPIAIGGGTYARVLPLGVAFGPCFPAGNNGMHCVDEYIDLSDFAKMSEIYYRALKALCF